MKITPQLKKAWTEWLEESKVHKKIPATNKTGPRMVFPPESREIRRMEYLARYHAVKSEWCRQQAELLKQKQKEKTK